MGTDRELSIYERRKSLKFAADGFKFEQENKKIFLNKTAFACSKECNFSEGKAL